MQHWNTTLRRLWTAGGAARLQNRFLEDPDVTLEQLLEQPELDDGELGAGYKRGNERVRPCPLQPARSCPGLSPAEGGAGPLIRV